MKHLQKHVALLLCAGMLLAALSGCGQPSSAGSTAPSGGSSAPAATTYQKTITFAPSLDFTSMEMQNESGGTAKAVYVLVFNTLIEYDTNNQKLVPGLAESWTQVSDLVWQFKLRQGVKFHNGSDFTAEDVKFTYDHGQKYSGFKNKLVAVTDVKVIDPYTVQYILNAPDSDILYKMCEPNTSIISKAAFDTLKEEEAWKIGTGPFRYGEWVQGDHLNLDRFDGYWDGPRNTERLVVKWIPEAASRLVALQTGEIDICIDPPSTDLHYVTEDPKLTLWEIPSSNIRHIFLNVNVEPFTNPKVRQAVAHAIDRDALIQIVYNGFATPAYNVMHPTLAGDFYEKNIKYYDYDLAEAKALLAEAGYPNGFQTTIYSSSGAVQKAVDSVIQAQLAEIGIDVEIQALETATFNAGVGHGGKYPIAVDGWGGHTMGPDYALRSVFHSTGNINRSNIEDPYVDGQIDKALQLKDESERIAIYKDIQQYVVNNANWLPLAVEQINACMKSTLQGFEMPLGLHHHLRNIYIVEN